MKRIALLALVLCLGLPLRGQVVADSLSLGEQVASGREDLPLKRQLPSGREKGYQGSIALSGGFIAMPIPITALEFSQGYRFNQYHFLGGGAALLLPYIGGFVPYLYTHYRVWWFSKRSTPYASLKLGYLGVIDSADFFSSGAPFVEPALGWDWGLSSGGGISLSLGAMAFIPDWEIILPIPNLTLTYRFQ